MNIGKGGVRVWSGIMMGGTVVIINGASGAINGAVLWMGVIMLWPSGYLFLFFAIFLPSFQNTGKFKFCQKFLANRKLLELII